MPTIKSAPSTITFTPDDFDSFTPNQSKIFEELKVSLNDTIDDLNEIFKSVNNILRDPAFRPDWSLLDLVFESQIVVNLTVLEFLYNKAFISDSISSYFKLNYKDKKWCFDIDYKKSNQNIDFIVTNPFPLCVRLYKNNPFHETTKIIRLIKNYLKNYLSDAPDACSLIDYRINIEELVNEYPLESLRQTVKQILNWSKTRLTLLKE